MYYYFCSFSRQPSKQRYQSRMSTCWTACDGLYRLLRGSWSSSKGSSAISSFTVTFFPLDDIISVSAGRLPDSINWTIDYHPKQTRHREIRIQIQQIFREKENKSNKSKPILFPFFFFGMEKISWGCFCEKP